MCAGRSRGTHRWVPGAAVCKGTHRQQGPHTCPHPKHCHHPLETLTLCLPQPCSLHLDTHTHPHSEGLWGTMQAGRRLPPGLHLYVHPQPRPLWLCRCPGSPGPPPPPLCPLLSFPILSSLLCRSPPCLSPQLPKFLLPCLPLSVSLPLPFSSPNLPIFCTLRQVSDIWVSL